MRHTTTAKLSVIPTNNNSMESLKLPVELFWDGKSEPTTPPSSELFPIAECSMTKNWIDEDDITNEIIDSEDDLKIELTIEDACELLNGDDLVMELCNLKDEHWSYTKSQPHINNYIDDYIIEPTLTQPNLLTKVAYPNVIDPVSGVCETTTVGADYFYAPVANSYDTAVLTQLTPPHSPPLQNTGIINSNPNITSPASNFNTIILQQQPQINEQAILLQIQTEQEAQPTLHWPACNNNDINAITTTSLTSATDTEIQTQIVDEIVNSRAKELVDWHDELDSVSCSSSSFGSSYQAESITDEDWLQNSEYAFETSASSASSSPIHLSNEQQLQDKSQDNNSITTLTSRTSQLKKRRAYGRDIEDRKLRKKEQNKNAATRYRQKKKLEMECVLSQEHELLARNEELKLEYSERKREAKYLKTLIREFYQKQQQKTTVQKKN